MKRGNRRKGMRLVRFPDSIQRDAQGKVVFALTNCRAWVPRTTHDAVFRPAYEAFAPRIVGGTAMSTPRPAGRRPRRKAGARRASGARRA